MALPKPALGGRNQNDPTTGGELKGIQNTAPSVDFELPSGQLKRLLAAVKKFDKGRFGETDRGLRIGQHFRKNDHRSLRYFCDNKSRRKLSAQGQQKEKIAKHRLGVK